MTLRPYQSEQVSAIRGALSRHKNVMAALPTGGGKTREFAEITGLATAMKNTVWIMVPRLELLAQASDHLSGRKVPHGMITAKHAESRAYSVHIVSIDTGMRRIRAGKIKNWPRLVIVDEAHLNFDRQIEIRAALPESSSMIGFTATPERLDGRGLDELYGEIVYGPTIKDLTEMDYLSPMRYFALPGFTPSELTSKDMSGTEVKADILDQILKSRHIYGNAVEHYRQNAHGKAAIVFTRSVEAAVETAERFRDAGYRFESIDGKMTTAKRKALIDGVRTRRLDGLTSCELVTYGLDVPRVECIIMLRPTMSRALFCQMIGRGLRNYESWRLPNGSIVENPHIPPPGGVLVDRKADCVILDHVGNLFEHGHPLLNNTWNFHGTEKRRKKKGVDAAALKLCPACFMYFEGATCDNCGAARMAKPRGQVQEVDGRLIEVKGPIKLEDRDPEDRREFQDKIGALIGEINDHDGPGIASGPIGELLKIAAELGKNAMWVYWHLSWEMKAVNVPLLHEIRRQKEYKPGWIFLAKEQVEHRLGRRG